MTSYDCSRVVEIEDEPRHHLIIANEYVRALAVTVPPHTRTLCHHHPHDYLIYVASGAEIISAARDEEPKKLNYGDGECELSPAGLVHVVENLSGTAFRNVVVELLPGANRLKRGRDPMRVAGEAWIERIFLCERGSIYNVEMKPGAEVEIAGPAVVASPHGGEIMMKELDEFNIPLDDFEKLAWVCAPRTVGVRNAGSAPARTVVFQIGSRVSN
jgi:quercetin dioxygenase-like cupin family protein